MSPLSIIPIEFATPEYDQSVRLRDAILRKPLGLEFTVEFLAKEYNYHHLVAYNEHLQMVGCLILAPQENQVAKMTQVAVVEELQGKGIGKAMVAAFEKYASDLGFKEIVLNARDVAIPFYEKLDYKKVGKPFTEVSIKHYKMTKAL